MDINVPFGHALVQYRPLTKVGHYVTQLYVFSSPNTGCNNGQLVSSSNYSHIFHVSFRY